MSDGEEGKEGERLVGFIWRKGMILGGSMNRLLIIIILNIIFLEYYSMNQGLLHAWPWNHFVP